VTKAIFRKHFLGGWRKDALPLLLFLFLPLLSFPELFLRTNTLYRADLTWIHYPLRCLAAEQWKSGLPPLWNPYVLSGTPLLAEAEIGVLQPLNVLFLLPIPPYRALTLFVTLNLTLAATFTYILARSLGIGRAGATLSGLSFGFGGFLMAQITNLNVMTGGVWLPLVFAAFVWALRSRRVAVALLGGVPLALNIFAGHPQMWLHSILFLIGYAAYETGRIILRSSQSSSRAREVATIWSLLGLMLGSGLLLAAPQVLPTWELQRLSVRSAGTEAGQAVFSIPPVQWSTLVFPSAFGNNVSPSYQGMGQTNFEETHVYIGILPLLLVPFSWRAGRRTEVPFFWLAALGGALLAMGTYIPLYDLLKNLPGFNLFRAPARWSVIVTLSLAMLAAYGFDSILSRPLGRRWRFGLLGLWVVVTATLLAAWYLKAPVLQWTETLSHHDHVIYTLRLLLRRGLFEVSDGYKKLIILGPLAWWVLPSVALVSRLGIGVALLVAYSARRLPRRAFVVAVIGLVAADVALAGGSAVNRQRDADHWEQISGGARYISQTVQGGTERFFAYASSKENKVVAGLKHYCPSVHHLFASGGHASLRLGRYDTFRKQAHPLIMLSLTGTRFVLNEGRLTPDAESVLPLVYQDDEWYVYEHPSALPHAFVMRQAIAVSSDEHALSYLREGDFDPLVLLVLQTDEPLPSLSPEMPTGPGGSATVDEIVITSYTPSSVEIQADLADDGYLVLLDSYYPGWTAYADGQPTPIMRAYYFARAIYLEGGRHTVKFVYRPISFYGGLGLAFAGLLIISLAAWLTRRSEGKPSLDELSTFVSETDASTGAEPPVPTDCQSH
jgi:hypothetical protein